MSKVYGSVKCPCCMVLKENLGNLGYRCSALIGEDGKVWTDWETWLKENGYEVFIPESSLSQACSIDRKGC